MKKSLILSVGMPRSGSGWVYNLTQDLIIASGGIDAGKIRKSYHLEKVLTQVNCNMGSLDFYRLLPVMFPLIFESPYVIKLHGGRKLLADVFIKLGLIKPTYIYRDPRDALLSAYEYGRRMREQGKVNAFTPIRSINDGIAFMERYVQIGKGWLSSSSTHHLRYEDLLRKYDQTVGGLLGFLGLSRDQELEEIIDRYRPGKGSSDQKGTHFEKGKIGRFRDHFSDHEKALCQEAFGGFLEAQGYSP